MKTFNFKIDINENKIKKKINVRTEKVLPLLTQEILKDANYFSPKLTGNLIGSSFLATNFRKGKIIYNTKYAKRVYYRKKVGTRINRNAKPKWFEYAKIKYLEIWLKKAKKMFNEM